MGPCVPEEYSSQTWKNPGYCIRYLARDEICITEMSLLSAARAVAQSMCPSIPLLIHTGCFLGVFLKSIVEVANRVQTSKSVIPSSEVPSFIFGRLSEASKILRCLEKGLNAAKLKQVKALTFPYTLLLTCIPLKVMLHSVLCFNLSTNMAHQVCSSLLLLTVIANTAFHPGSRFSDGDDDEDSD